MSPSNQSIVMTEPATTTDAAGTASLAERADTPRGRRFGSLRSLLGVLIGAMLVLLLISAAVTGIARWAVETANHQLLNRVLPADQAVRELTTAYVDQETGQRGFLITGDPAFLQPYTQGQTDAARLRAALATLLADEPSVMQQLGAVTDRAQSWAASAAVEITGRQSGALTQPELSASAAADRQLFDALRVELADLGAATDRLTNAQLQAISTAQTIANTVTAAALALAVGVATLSVWVIRHRLTRPLRRLQTQVQQVAGGDYHQPIAVDGPDEVVSIGQSVNSMRENLLHNSADLVAAEHTVTLIEEKDRVAAALHDGATQRLFRLGLALTSAARRHPRLAELFTALVTETDHIMQELRAVALELSTTPTTEDLVVRVSNAVDTAAAAMSFVPTVDVVGPVATQSTDPATA